MTRQNLKDILQGVVGKVDTAKQDAIPTYTQQEYEAVKDTIPDGTIFNISDDVPVLSARENSGGTSDYNELFNKPSVNSVELSDNKTADDLNLQLKIPTYTRAEYEEIKDTIPTGTLFNISDDSSASKYDSLHEILNYLINTTPLYNLKNTGKWESFNITSDVTTLKILERYSNTSLNVTNSWLIDVATLPTYAEYTTIGKNRLGNDINMAKSGNTIYISEANDNSQMYTLLDVYKGGN